MLEVQIENILPVTEARDKLNQLVDSVESSDNMYVMTKNGKPSAILVGVHHLEKLTGEKHDELFGNNNKSNETEESMSDDPMNPAASANATPAPATDFGATATPAAGAATNDVATTPPVVEDVKSEVPAMPDATATVEPDPMSSIAPAPSEPVVPTATPAPTAMGAPAPSAFGAPIPTATPAEDEADADDSSAMPTPPPATPAV